MGLKDLSGKSVHDLDWEDFEKLFCQRCRYQESCVATMVQVNGCKTLVDTGLWDKFYRRQGC